MESLNNLKSLEIKKYIDEIPFHLRNIFLSVRDLILFNLPLIKEEILHGKLFYFLGNKKILFITYFADRVVLNFINGSQISDIYNLYSSSSKKDIRSIDFRTIKDTYNSKVIYYLNQSAALNISKNKSQIKSNSIYA